MATTYCTPEDVAKYCNLIGGSGERAVFGTDPVIPDDSEIEDYINIVEGILEEQLKMAWGTRYITVTEELQDIWRDRQEASLHLNFPNVATFATGQGDKLEIWDGTQWIDYITTYTEGRGDDFFVDYRMGKIYFLQMRPSIGKLRARITYRYNAGSTIPTPIKLASCYWVGVMLANSPHASILFPSGEGEDQSLENQIARWEKMIAKLIEPFDSGNVPVNMSFYPIA